MLSFALRVLYAPFFEMAAGLRFSGQQIRDIAQAVFLLLLFSRSVVPKDARYGNVYRGTMNELAMMPTFQLNSSSFTLGGLFDLIANQVSGVNIYGVQRLEAFRAAIHYLNVAGRGKGRIPIHYHVIDSAGTVQGALSAGLSLLQRKLPLIIGPSSSDATLSVSSLYSHYNVSVIGYSAVSHLINTHRAVPFLRTDENDMMLSRALAQTLAALGFTLVSPIYSNDTYGWSFRSAFESIRTEYAIQTVCTGSIPFGASASDIEFINTQDVITRVIDCIATSISTVVVLFMNLSNAANFIQYLYDNPSNSRINIITVDGCSYFITDPLSFCAGKFPMSYLKGTMGICSYPGNTTIFQQWLGHLTPLNANYSTFTKFWEATFRCFYGSSWLDVPLCPENTTLRGLPISCRCTGTENLTSALIDPKVGRVQDSVFATVAALDRILYDCKSIPFKDYCNATEITGYDLFMVMSAFSTVGTDGLISFTGCDRTNLTIQIFQVNEYAKPTFLGIYDTEHSHLRLNMSALQFKHPGIPISAVVPQNTTVSSVSGAMVTVIAAIVIVVAVLCMIYFYIYRAEPIIKKSSPVFCQLILLGIIFMSVGLILWSFPQSMFTCVAKAWVTIIGFGLIMGNLLAKTYRIFKIFSNIRVTASAIRDRDLLLFSAAVILVEVILLLIYTFGAAIPHPSVIVSSTNYLYSYIVCGGDDFGFHTHMTIAILVFNGILIILAAIIAFLTRNVDSAFNESKYIGATVYCYTLLAIITIPLYVKSHSTNGVALTQYLERSIAVLAALIFTLAALFGSKFMTIAKDKGYFARRSAVSAQPSTLEGPASSESLASSRRSARQPKFMSELLWRGTRDTAGSDATTRARRDSLLGRPASDADEPDLCTHRAQRSSAHTASSPTLRGSATPGSSVSEGPFVALDL